MSKRPVLIAALLALVTAMTGPGGATAIQTTPVQTGGPTLAGQLLVATPELEDPNFRHTVVYMVEHNDRGAVGVVINRVLGPAPLGELLRRLGIVEGADSETEIQIHLGGPVQLEQIFVLHSPDYRRDDPLVVDDLAACSFSPDALSDIAVGHGPRNSLFGFGYAGWAAQQLEGEIAQGSWFAIPADEALLFDDAVATKWQRALALRGFDL
jgi:putative transcriptional regulator